MRRIRKGNDFVFLWTITTRGVPEDLVNATNLKLVQYVGAFGYGGGEIPCQALDNGELRVEVTPQMTPTVGKYYFELSYEREDATLSDQDRKIKIDVDAFKIVERTERAEEIFIIKEATDTLIALRGKPLR